MGGTFTHKFILTILAGLVAATLLWFFRHIVQRSLHETGDGWSEMFETGKKKP